MSDSITEAHAAHVDALAYSQCDNEEEPPPRRGVTVALAATVTVIASITVTLAVTLSALPSDRTPATVQVMPAPAPSQSDTPSTPPAPPSTPWMSPAPASPKDDPDQIFSTGWNQQMQAYPFPPAVCRSNTLPDGCWLKLDADVQTTPEFDFLGRRRCAYIRDHPGRDALYAAARDIRVQFPGITIEQSNELVRLAVHAYCPEYE